MKKGGGKKGDQFLAPSSQQSRGFWGGGTRGAPGGVLYTEPGIIWASGVWGLSGSQILSLAATHF